MTNFTKTYWLSFLVPLILLLTLIIIPVLYNTVYPSHDILLQTLIKVAWGFSKWLIFNFLVYLAIYWLFYKFIAQYLSFGFWCYWATGIIFIFANYTSFAYLAKAHMGTRELMVILASGTIYGLLLNLVAFLINRKFKNKAPE